MKKFLSLLSLLAALALGSARAEKLAILGETIHTMAGEPLKDSFILVSDGKIERVSSGQIPEGYRQIKAKVVTPGWIDARGTFGLSGMLNQPHDQEQNEKTAPIQPELRALDSYNPRDPLVKFVRDLGVTTVHAAQSPNALVSGQSIVVKTFPGNVEKALIKSPAMLIVTLGESAVSAPEKAPGNRAKAVAMLRAELFKARDYSAKMQKEEDKRPARDLKLEALSKALAGELPMLITAHRHHEILSVLRLAREFEFQPIIDGAAEAYMVLDQIKESGLPVILHPTMFRSSGQFENLSFETAGKLKSAGIPFAIQSGYEGYVPKTRVVLFEAALAAAHGLAHADALASITINAANILGIANRVGSIEPGKDADLALFDGDPFEYLTHCIGVIISGQVVSSSPN
jgi:imidazolonepropionase-like amidohydrolase